MFAFCANSLKNNFWEFWENIEVTFLTWAVNGLQKNPDQLGFWRYWEADGSLRASTKPDFFLFLPRGGADSVVKY